MSAVQRTSDTGIELDRAGGAGEWRLSHSCAGGGVVTLGSLFIVCV
jgi:hypothetical protein